MAKESWISRLTRCPECGAEIKNPDINYCLECGNLFRSSVYLKELKKRLAKPREKVCKKAEMEKIDAVIDDVKLYTDTSHFIENFDECYPVEDLWSSRSKLYGDTDVIAVRLKPSNDKKFTDIFPVVLRFDGTLEPNATTRRSRRRRARLRNFLIHYKINEKTEDYSIPEKMKEWKGKKVKIVTYAGRPQIFVPNYLVRDLYPTIEK